MATDSTPTTASPELPTDRPDPPGRAMPAASATPDPTGEQTLRVRGLLSHYRLLALVAVLAVLAPLVVAAAQQNDLKAPSPATGHASVLAQGIVQFPDGEFVCRVVERIAEPLGTARFEERDLGFVIATEGALLLADEADGAQEQVARLAIGELYLVQDGTRQRRASASAESVTYTVLEIVVANRATEVGDGRLLLASDPIGAPSGFRDLDLVEDVLALNERSQVSNPGAGMVILATDGAVEVVPRGGRPRTLQEGELGIFPEGVEVRSVEGTGGSAKNSVVSSLRHALGKQSSVGGSSFLACVIGPEIPPLSESPGVVPRTVPGPGNVPAEPAVEPDDPVDTDDPDDQGSDDPAPVDPTPTTTPRSPRDVITTEPTPTPTLETGTLFKTPAVFVISPLTPTPARQPEG